MKQRARIPAQMSPYFSKRKAADYPVEFQPGGYNGQGLQSGVQA
jgi:hypothetical protein